MLPANHPSGNHLSGPFPSIVSGRGLLFLITAAYLALGPASQSADIVAAVIAAVLLGMLIIFILATLFTTFVVRRKLRQFPVEITAAPLELDTDNRSPELGTIFSGKPCRLSIKIPNISILPLSYLSLKANFFHEELTSTEHYLYGATPANSERWLHETITFPHRGNWELGSISMVAGDRFGLTSLRWTLSVRTKEHSADLDTHPLAVISVRPPLAYCSQLQIISSSSRAGDDLPDQSLKSGDPYDLRRYEPSDGAKRIVWKLYAKSGNLVSRHPEAATTPEGQVVIFSLATSAQDSAVSLAVEYAKRCEALNLNIFAGCAGRTEQIVPQSSVTLEQEAITSTWNFPILDAELAAANLLELCKLVGQSSSKIERVLIFVAADQVQQESTNELLDFATKISNDGYMPIFFVAVSRTALTVDGPGLLFEQQLQLSIEQMAQSRNSFATFCHQSGWGYFEVEL